MDRPAPETALYDLQAAQEGAQVIRERSQGRSIRGRRKPGRVDPWWGENPETENASAYRSSLDMLPEGVDLEDLLDAVLATGWTETITDPVMDRWTEEGPPDGDLVPVFVSARTEYELDRLSGETDWSTWEIVEAMVRWGLAHPADLRRAVLKRFGLQNPRGRRRNMRRRRNPDFSERFSRLELGPYDPDPDEPSGDPSFRARFERVLEELRPPGQRKERLRRRADELTGHVLSGRNGDAARELEQALGSLGDLDPDLLRERILSLTSDRTYERHLVTGQEDWSGWGLHGEVGLAMARIYARRRGEFLERISEELGPLFGLEVVLVHQNLAELQVTFAPTGTVLLVLGSRRNPDVDLRRLGRMAAQGDRVAAEKLRRALRRMEVVVPPERQLPAPFERDTGLVPSPYYHQLVRSRPSGENEHVGGWGIWNECEEDWEIPDGYATEEEAQAGIRMIAVGGAHREWERTRRHGRYLPCPTDCEYYTDAEGYRWSRAEGQWVWT